MSVDRHFYRCTACCYVFAVDGKRAGVWKHDARDPKCDCCDPPSQCEWMGQVQGNTLIRVEERCPCDSRCTHALGGHCDCVCNGANHGTGRVVRVITNLQGIPVIEAAEPREVRAARVAEIAAAKAEAFARADRATDGALTLIRNGERVPNKDHWLRAEGLAIFIRRAAGLKSHRGRLTALAKIAAEQTTEAA